MMIFVQAYGTKQGQKGEARSDRVIGASTAECVLHLQGYANEASFHLLSCEGTAAIAATCEDAANARPEQLDLAANAANARPEQLDLQASPAYSSNLAVVEWSMGKL